ncbi:MAG: substrate-binding domain-containing protein [Pseudomonadota bacterium]
MRFVLLLAALLAGSAAAAATESMRLAVTTSFHNSGLAEVLLPAIKEDLDLDVQLLVVGTGQALRLGEAGDVDAVLVHSKAAEEAFVAEGYGTHRREIMFNDFVLVGPSADPAKVGLAPDILAALRQIAAGEQTFVSRGDDSGTHRRELGLFEAAGVDPETGTASWYRGAGQGMGATLNTASGLSAYVLSDRASWLNFANKGGLAIVFEGDPRLHNQYTFLPVDPDRHTHVKADAAKALEDWLTGETGQAMIAAYTLNGEPLFVPNAKLEWGG